MACLLDTSDGADCEAGMFGYGPRDEAWTSSNFHRAAASALLDGFTVDELTEAGG